ncbi:reverse transcriptase [Lasius niger]|uniref:Reverse transcriptase n=1 Tax=Lasius niger TaxID=67767 RepID=A0A0J7K5N7_LASNI|nr:reverse transcriptase [Lasius niger]
MMESGLKTQNRKQIFSAKHLAEMFKPFPQSTAEENVALIKKADEADIPPISLKELKNMCRHNKAPGYDLITGQIMKQLPDLALRKLQYIINVCFKLRYVPRHWKTAEVIVIPKPGKPPTEVTSYRPISLLPIMSKIFEKILLKRLSKLIEERQLLPNHQFGFRAKHSRIDQVHRITDMIEKAFEEKKVCIAVFLDVAQAKSGMKA